MMNLLLNGWEPTIDDKLILSNVIGVCFSMVHNTYGIKLLLGVATLTSEYNQSKLCKKIHIFWRCKFSIKPDNKPATMFFFKLFCTLAPCPILVGPLL